MVSTISTGKTIAKNTFSLLVSGIICGILQFIVIAYLARILGPDNFGKVNFALAIVVYFTLMANIGLPVLGTREIAKNREKPQSIIKRIIALRFLLSLAGFIILCAITLIFTESATIRYLLILYGIGVIPSALLVDWVFQGLEKMEYVAIGNLVSAIVYFGLIISFVKNESQLLLIPIFQVIATVIAVIILFIVLGRQIKPAYFEISHLSYRDLLYDTLPIGISLLATQIFYNIDTVILGIIRSTEEVGYYSAAYKIIMVFIVFIGYFHNSIFPVISDYYQSSTDSLMRLLSISQKFMVILAFPLVFGGTILAYRIIKLIYGTEYNNAVLPFQILLWAVFIIFINTSYSRTLLASKNERWYLLGTVIPAVINVLLNIVLIPLFGMTGAAVVTVISEFAGFLIMYAGFRTIVSIPFWELFFKPFFSAFIMSLFLVCGILLFNINLFILISTGALIYFVSLRLIQGITDDEILLIKKILMPKM